MITNRRVDEFEICDEDGSRVLTIEDVEQQYPALVKRVMEFQIPE